MRATHILDQLTIYKRKLNVWSCAARLRDNHHNRLPLSLGVKSKIRACIGHFDGATYWQRARSCIPQHVQCECATDLLTFATLQCAWAHTCRRRQCGTLEHVVIAFLYNKLLAKEADYFSLYFCFCFDKFILEAAVHHELSDCAECAHCSLHGYGSIDASSKSLRNAGSRIKNSKKRVRWRSTLIITCRTEFNLKQGPSIISSVSLLNPGLCYAWNVADINWKKYEKDTQWSDSMHSIYVIWTRNIRRADTSILSRRLCWTRMIL